MTGYERLAVTGGETGATTDDDHRLARIRTRTGSLDEDDVAQEVCLALLSALPSYRDMGRPFGAFVCAIAAHKVADAARGKSVDARLARALLAHLPAAQRRLLLLRVVGGLSAEDNGYVPDMSPGAVRVAQHRTLVRLRALAADEAACP